MATTNRPTENPETGTEETLQDERKIPVVYSCQHGFCTAVQRQTHLGAIGNIAMMVAVNTNVKIKFTAGSPFGSVTEIDIPKGGIHEQVVVAAGTFPYNLSCKNPSCPTVAAPPEMIVP